METFAANVRKGRGSCFFCKGEHFSDECDQYKELSDRKQRLLSQGRCFLCLKMDHTVKDCKNILGRTGSTNPQKYGGNFIIVVAQMPTCLYQMFFVDVHTLQKLLNS